MNDDFTCTFVMCFGLKFSSWSFAAARQSSALSAGILKMRREDFVLFRIVVTSIRQVPPPDGAACAGSLAVTPVIRISKLIETIRAPSIHCLSEGNSKNLTKCDDPEGGVSQVTQTLQHCESKAILSLVNSKAILSFEL